MISIDINENERKEIKESLKNSLEIYKQEVIDYRDWNETKKDTFMSKFSQEKCNEQINYYQNKANLVETLLDKL